MNTGAKRVYKADEWLDVALNLCKGSYQRDIVTGRQRVSGADLKGKAAKYSGKYSASRNALFDRMEKAKVPFDIRRPARGPHELVFLDGPAS